jgi:16S rRNA (cytidine1402-2'-O)-methyltransferase
MPPFTSAGTTTAEEPRPADVSVSLSAALYVVATPIGNLEDLGRRAARILRSVAVIAAEDTRTSRPLLQSIGAGARCIALHAHNEAQVAGELVARVAQGEAVALITDAGTPGISDPGARLVAAAHEAGVRVVPIPGASAATVLVSAAGLPEGRFLFEGFLPSRPKHRRDRLAVLAAMPFAFLLFEAPHRIEETAADLAAVIEPDRPLVLGRELTKQFEQIVRMPVAALPAWLAAESNHRRGEFALLVFPASRSEGDDAGTGAEQPELSETGLRALAVLAEVMPPRQAARLAARIGGDAADDLYKHGVMNRKPRKAADASESVAPEDPDNLDDPDDPDDSDRRG